jgi:hypothetical protein
MRPAPKERLYSGWAFSQEQIQMIRDIIGQGPGLNRAQLSRIVCERLPWLGCDGRLKEMSCRVAMLRMHRDGLIVLPAATTTNGNGRRGRAGLDKAPAAPCQPICAPAGKLGPLALHPAATRRDCRLWNELVERWHYLGCTSLPGAKIRYFVYAGQNLVGLLAFNAAAWRVAPRDDFIGWNTEQRQQNLHLVVNNARFVILPWVCSKNLASRILGFAARQLPRDWKKRYGWRPALMETFVETPRFGATCYRAANWIRVGQTKGRGKRDRYHANALPRKDIYLYPLQQDFRTILCQKTQTP